MEEKNKEKELILCSLLDAALHAEPHVENQAALKQKWERLKQQETEWESILSIAVVTCAAAFVMTYWKIFCQRTGQTGKECRREVRRLYGSPTVCFL